MKAKCAVKKLGDWNFDLDHIIDLNKIGKESVEQYLKVTEFGVDLHFPKGEICIYDEADKSDVFNINIFTLINKTIDDYHHAYNDEQSDLKAVRRLKKLVEKLEHKIEKTYKEFEMSKQHDR